MRKVANLSNVNARATKLVPIQKGGKRKLLTKSALIVKDQSGYEIIPFHEILRCEAESNYTNIVLTNGKVILSSKSLKHIENELPANLFIRVHKSHVVSIREIRRISSDSFVELSNGNKIPVSRRKKSTIFSQLGI